MSIPQPSLSETILKKRPISFSGKNVNQVKLELTAQLNDKEKLLGKEGTSQITRNALLKQTEVIKKELIQLNKYEQEEELPEEIRSKLEGLANEVQFLKSSKSTSLQDANLSKQTMGFSPLLPPPPTNSSPTKHRTKTANNNRRNPDIEFATEIGQGLLIEVRKLQAALQEKEEIIKQLELSKSDNERTYESNQRILKQREEIEERLKEENWNLEVANQELRTHLSESNQLVVKHNAEYSKLTKKLKSQSEQLDIMKAQEEKSNSVIEAMKARHEQETYHLRRHAASAQRDNTQLQKQLESLNTELKICKAKLAVKLAVSSRVTEETPTELDTTTLKESLSDNESNNNNSAQQSTPSTQSNNRNQAMETETLKQSLAHAHRIISNLRSSLHKEKLEKFEVKKMLSDSQENIEQMRKEMSSWNANNAISFGNARANGKKKALAKKKRGGVARRARGLCANESDTENQQQKQSKFSNDEEKDEESDKGDEEEEGDLEYDNSMEEEEDDDDESLDDDDTMMDPQFSFGSFGQTPFSSVPMVPLSSELENKVQVIDVGINTDPVEFLSVTQQDRNTHFDSLVAPITVAIIKERQAIAQRAESILSPEQIELLLPKETRQLDVQQESEILSAVQREVSLEEKQKVTEQMVPKQQVDVMIAAAIQESVKEMVPKQQVDALVEQTKQQMREELGEMVPKQEVDVLIEEAKQQTRKGMIPKEEHESILEEAREQTRAEFAEMIPKPEVDTLLAEAKESCKLEMRPVIEKEVKEHMVPKETVDLLVQEIRLEAKAEVEKVLEDARKSEEGIKQAVEQSLKKDMILQTEAAVLVEKAIQKTKSELETTIKSEQELRQSIEEQLKQSMVPKSEVDTLLDEIKMKTRAEALQNASPLQEQLRSSVEEELKQEMVPKVQVRSMIEEAVQQARQEVSVSNEEMRAVIEREIKETMIPKSEVDSLISDTANFIREEARKDMLSKTEVDAMVLAAVASATQVLKHELDQHKQESANKLSEEQVNALILVETEKVQNTMKETLEKQRLELEMNKSKDLEEMDRKNKEEVEKVVAEMEAAKKSELEQHRKEFVAEKQAELEQQKKEIYEHFKSELETQKSEMEKALEEAVAAKTSEVSALSIRVEAQKKECDELKQRMVTMLTKDSADVLIKRAVTEAVETAEKKHAEALSGMISREYSLRMVNDEVEKALEKERKEVAEREEQFMISKTEAEALAKVAAADAIVKERQAMAAREKELITKEEAELMTQAAVKEAIDKEKSESAALLAKERKLMKEKEQQMISKEEAGKKTNEAVQLALIEYKKTEPLESPLPTQFTQGPGQMDDLHKPRSIERSVSTSRLAPPTVNVSPAPSVSTPASSTRRLRLSSSVSSLRLGNNRNDQPSKNPRQSTDSTGPTFGSLRILETTKYESSRHQPKSSLSLRDLSKKQKSSTSISTMSSNDESASISGRTPLPMSSNDSFPGFTGSESTNMEVISAITQTMIGEWMSKHTRRYVGGGISENKHQRFFWVHPYTRILYWSSSQPGAEGSQAKTKNAYIESVTSVRSNDTTGASPKSLLIRTPKRDLKITATSLERHELWLKSLSYLLGRPTSVQEESQSATSSFVEHAGQPQQNTLSSRTSNAIIADAIQYDSDDSEDMVNIRQCCDGKHDVSTLSRGHHHHH